MLVDVDMVTVQMLYALYGMYAYIHNACYVRKVSCLEFALMFAVSHMNML